ncbi:hypothetical protein FS749_015492 [Ceratobasidium sp. UAMH 11750]|nr:hypothetical protein FS749_015492 [Ceratobasidium sp. UAMH 11750]
MFDFDNIANLFNVGSTQPDTPSDAFGMDWSLDTASVMVPFDYNNSVPQDPTMPDDLNFMFPGLCSENLYQGDSSWVAEPTQSPTRFVISL